MIENIFDLMMLLAPTATSVVGIIVGIIKYTGTAKRTEKSFEDTLNDLREDFKYLKDNYEASERKHAESEDMLRHSLSEVMTENADLKRMLKEERQARTGVKED